MFPMTDKEILQALRKGDEAVTREYFYGWCRMAYRLCDERYELCFKEGMDFYSLAHDFYLRMAFDDWQAAERRRPELSLCTWMVNGFRFLVLDKLKTLRDDVSLDDGRGLDGVADTFAADVRDMVEDIASGNLLGDETSRMILRKILLEGYSGKEVASMLNITPSALSQRYSKLMKSVVIPHFQNFFELPETISEITEHAMLDSDLSYLPSRPTRTLMSISVFKKPKYKMQPNRITPDRIKTLQPGEIFVFGSNLQGMHGGGAAFVALRNFGAVMGQGVGLQGQSYAIPTMQGGVETIRPYVDEFIDFARQHPDLHFYVTRIGCGIAGFDDADIAPLFRDAMPLKNVALPRTFWLELNEY